MCTQEGGPFDGRARVQKLPGLHQGTHIDSVECLEKAVNTFRTRVQDGINVQKLQIKLDEYEAQLAKTCTTNSRSSLSTSRIGGASARTESLGSSAGGTGLPPSVPVLLLTVYLRPLCIIELYYKEKFKHMIGNVLSLGAMLIYFH